MIQVSPASSVAASAAHLVTGHNPAAIDDEQPLASASTTTDHAAYFMFRTAVWLAKHIFFFTSYRINVSTSTALDIGKP